MRYSSLLYFSAFVFLLFAETVASAKAPVPVRERGSWVTEKFVGWEKIKFGDDFGKMNYMHRPKRGSQHFGSALWFYSMKGHNKTAAFTASARAGKLTKLRILARYPMQKAKLLDNRGSGEVFIADAIRPDRGAYRIAAIVIHGSLDKSSPPALGVHMFVAPKELYAKMGGWTVNASMFLGLDPAKEVRDVYAQGRASPALQARRLAGTADIWAQWVLEQYIQLAQSNLRAMSNFRKSVVCAGDPSCVIVPGN